MAGFDLNEILKSAKTPEWPEEYWEDFPRSITHRLGARSRIRGSESSWFPWLMWGSAFAVVCLTIVVAIHNWPEKWKTTTNDGLLQNSKLIQETLAMFPQRVRAIVQDEKGLNLILSEQNDVPASPPLYVQLCDGKQCASVVTFSGQEIQIAGEKITVLSDARGGVILEGDDFVWSSAERDYAKNGLKIEAKRLAATRM